jgi:uncharacterized cupin superfamily protein
MRRFNLNDAEPEYDSADPEGYRAGEDRVGARIGATQLGATVYELPPGQSICPYHYEYPEEEWLLGLSGRVVLRTPEGEEEIGPMDVACFPMGPEGAHKVTNRTEETARVVMFSTKPQVSVAVYPDSGKMLANTGNREDRLMARRESAVDYYDGEVER